MTDLHDDWLPGYDAHDHYLEQRLINDDIDRRAHQAIDRADNLRKREA